MSVVAFDLDDVICSRTSNDGRVEKYKTCYPHQDMVDIVNKCYDKGHTIIIYTARGMTGFGGNEDDIYVYALGLVDPSNLFLSYRHHRMRRPEGPGLRPRMRSPPLPS